MLSAPDISANTAPPFPPPHSVLSPLPVLTSTCSVLLSRVLRTEKSLAMDLTLSAGLTPRRHVLGPLQVCRVDRCISWEGSKVRIMPPCVPTYSRPLKESRDVMQLSFAGREQKVNIQHACTPKQASNSLLLPYSCTQALWQSNTCTFALLLTAHFSK